MGWKDQGVDVADVVRAIERWCETHLGKVLPVVYEKDYHMAVLFDDRAVAVTPNNGHWRVEESENDGRRAAINECFAVVETVFEERHGFIHRECLTPGQYSSQRRLLKSVYDQLTTRLGNLYP
jgi:hypothetical protein